jgi:hypothetical protein
MIYRYFSEDILMTNKHMKLLNIISHQRESKPQRSWMQVVPAYNPSYLES